MESRARTRPAARIRRESGHLLLIVMMGLTVMAIMLGAAVQQWSAIQRRENELELIFRGNQYVKAIKLYQAEHGGALPTSLEILVKPGPRRLRYIRRLYRDPMAPDGKWGILLADPSGRGYINPNAPPDTGEGEIQGLEDLGKGMKTSMQTKLKASSLLNSARSRAFSAKSGSDSMLDETPTGNPDATVKSVTAPGQPVGPIVGVVSLADQASFRLYRQHENYSEWAFNIFEDGQTGKQQRPLTPVPTPGMGVGPGASQTIMVPGGGCIGLNCPPAGGGPGGGLGGQPPTPKKPPGK